VLFLVIVLPRLLEARRAAEDTDDDVQTDRLTQAELVNARKGHRNEPVPDLHDDIPAANHEEDRVADDQHDAADELGKPIDDSVSHAAVPCARTHRTPSVEKNKPRPKPRSADEIYTIII